jgi:hypothetical protein
MSIPRKPPPPPVAAEGRDLQPTERFTKVDDELIRLGVPFRAAMLYGKLAYYTREGRLCYRKWATLAEEVGLKDPSAVYRLLLQLKALKLVEWKRHGRHTNQYWALVPDVAFIRQTLQECNVSDIARPQGQTLRSRNVSDIAKPQCRKESIGSLKEELKRTPSIPQAPPSQKPEPTPNICAPDGARGGASSLPKTRRSGDDSQGWFAAWWAIYWRKVAKKAAEKAFRAHVKTPERFAQVMTATKQQTPAMMARDPDKRPHAASWLNGERWNDPVEAPARIGPQRALPYDSNAVDYPELPKLRRS